VQRKWNRWLGWGAVLFSLVFMGVILWKSAAQLRELAWRQFMGPAAIGLVLYGVSLAAQALVWTVLAAKLSASPWGGWDIQVYCTTHLTRRLPGLPWYMAGRALAYREQGRSGEAALAASLFEWGGMFIAAVFWAALGQWGWEGVLVVLLASVILLTLLSLIWRRLPGAKKWQLLVRMPVGWLLLAIFVYLGAWLLGGEILYLLTRSLEMGLSLFDITPLWALGGGASMMMIFVPAGLGIREMTLTFLLGPYLGEGRALVIALLLRILFTVGDLMWGGMFWWVGWMLAHHLTPNTP
jgi:uncharacterized membrane protein YbhN (UPF0104 family)